MPRHGHFTPGKRPGTHCVGSWVGSKAGLDGCGKSLHHRDSIPGPSSPLRVAIPTELLYYTKLINNYSNDPDAQSYTKCNTLHFQNTTYCRIST